ncbi:hypothetical protein [Compostimonas suwonensis]|uniref:Uncharacterized protein n=1 Tax=Compostimonas suwonensis TaxID=1048394 RepID=A0A2M9C5D8_9MICO|nr:hypothetical protein [Compostimonas suwonensis]PJJ65709.1 hypothetical protein CLV54_0746 [Compostimonas suwonensis]
MIDGGGGGGVVTSTDGRINPALIPGPDLDPEKLGTAASALTTTASGVRTSGAAVVTQWGGLAGVYSAPESGQLLTVMADVGTDSTTFGDKLDAASRALSTYADAIEPIKKKLEDLRIEAQEFVDSIANGVLVQPWDPDHPLYYATYGNPDGGAMGAAINPPDPERISWLDHGPSVDRNRELIHAVADQYALLDQAQVACANTINGLLENSCAAPLEAVEAWQLKQDGVELPWGTAVEKNRDCGESFVHGVGEAFVGMGEGLGSLVGRNALTGEWGDGDFALQAWRGLGMTLVGVATVGPLTLGIRFAPPGVVPQGLQDFVTESQDYAAGAVKGIVAFDTWSENPAEAAGTALVNIGTFFIPGGAVVGGIKAGSIGARLASVVTHVADFAVPGGSFIIKGGANVAAHVGGLFNLAGDAASGGVSAIRGALANALHNAADHIPTVHVELPSGITPDGISVGASAPQIHIGDPGSGGGWLHSIADRVDGDSGASTSGVGHGGGPDADAGPSTPSHAPAPDGSPTGSGSSADGSDRPSAVDDAPVHGDSPAYGDTASGSGDASPDGSTASGVDPADQLPMTIDKNGHGIDELDLPSNVNPDDVAWFDSEKGTWVTFEQKAVIDDFLDHSTQVEPAISDAMQSIKADVPGAQMLGWDYRLKTADSLYGKFYSEMLDNPGLSPESLVDRMRDTVRYTFGFDAGDYVSGTRSAVQHLLDEGFQPVADKFKNTWENPGYVGINSSWIDKSGRIFEVQFHTGQSFEAKTITHAYYEELRSPGITPERYAELNRLQNEISSQVVRPDGASDIRLADFISGDGARSSRPGATEAGMPAREETR